MRDPMQVYVAVEQWSLHRRADHVEGAQPASEYVSTTTLAITPDVLRDHCSGVVDLAVDLAAPRLLRVGRGTGAHDIDGRVGASAEFGR